MWESGIDAHKDGSDVVDDILYGNEKAATFAYGMLPFKRPGETEQWRTRRTA